MDEATPERPIYTKSRDADSGATALYSIVCDEGWRGSIVCTGMYEWAADRLLDLLGRRPYTPERRP